ncbi:iron transporter [Sulfobacillus sp. DSM 109850]|uniref:Iron transporter n=2 Tax=Sulfobacillus harzensis TaxID=2729629 RepID=A0A7Y0L613_9FIRM|nr:iron transporter [Sulfobacillus harzensis]
MKGSKPKQSKSQSGLIREGIFGFNDGLVATIGLVSGEALSHQPHTAIVIAGLSAVGAAVVSMAVGSFLATSSENDFMRREIQEQAQAIDRHPHRERHHVLRLLDEIGVPDEHNHEVAKSIIATRPRWLKFMVRENLGIHQNRAEAPLKNSLVMGSSVLIGSAPPILPYLFSLPLVTARDVSWSLSIIAALGLGMVKGVLTRTPLLKSALSFGVLVSLSALVGALIGMGLGALGA